MGVQIDKNGHDTAAGGSRSTLNRDMCKERGGREPLGPGKDLAEEMVLSPHPDFTRQSNRRLLR